MKTNYIFTNILAWMLASSAQSAQPVSIFTCTAYCQDTPLVWSGQQSAVTSLAYLKGNCADTLFARHSVQYSVSVLTGYSSGRATTTYSGYSSTTTYSPPSPTYSTHTVTDYGPPASPETNCNEQRVDIDEPQTRLGRSLLQG